MSFISLDRYLSLRPAVIACMAALAGLAVAANPALAANGFSEPTPAEKTSSQSSDAAWTLSNLQNLNAERASGRLDLAQAWRLTVLNDPEYQAALSARAAAETERRQGRAAILPQIQAGHSRSRITGDQTQYSPFGGARTGELDYDSSSTYVQLQQPIVNFGRYADYRRGIARAELGEAEFHQREQETALLLAETYLNALRGESQWQLARQLAKSLEVQAVAQERLYESSEGDRIDAQETQARLALAKSDEIRTRDERDVALRELESMIGRPVSEIAGLKDGFQPMRLQPAKLHEWVAMARQSAPAVRVAQEQVQVAETELRRATARHMPSLDLVGTYSKADSENLSSLSQRTNTWSVGFNANIPIFSGGYDSANRARASAELDQARDELRAAEEVAAAEATRHYSNVIGGEQRIRALMAAVKSTEQSLVAAQESYRYGMRSNVDVLRSQDRLYESRSQLADATIDYLYASAALNAATGELDEVVFQYITNTHLAP